MVMQAVDPSIKRLKCLLRHIENVRNDCEILGSRLIEAGEFEFGKNLIHNGLIHDASKFTGLEWDQLTGCHDDALLHEAIRVHATSNPHHPEYWGTIHEMPRLYIAEMVADWASRSAEFGSALRPWIDDKATEKFGFTKNDKVYGDITEFLNLLLEPAF